MQTNNLNNVKVIFSNSQYNYETNVSANATEQTTKEYFVGKYFDLGIYPKEDFQKCIGIEFTDNNSMPEFKKGDFAMVVLGSSEDQINGDKVLIDEIIHHNNKTTVNCITTKTKHKFWCHYSDLMPITKI